MTNSKALVLTSFVLLCACSSSSRHTHPISEKAKNLVISVSDASYDRAKKQATITMDDAYQKSRTISAYNGERITVLYKGFQKSIDTCPEINTSLKNVQREIDFSANEVTIIVSNVTQDLANQIKHSECFSIDSYTVKEVSNLGF